MLKFNLYSRKFKQHSVEQVCFIPFFKMIYQYKSSSEKVGRYYLKLFKKLGSEKLFHEKIVSHGEILSWKQLVFEGEERKRVGSMNRRIKNE